MNFFLEMLHKYLNDVPYDMLLIIRWFKFIKEKRTHMPLKFEDEESRNF